MTVEMTEASTPAPMGGSGAMFDRIASRYDLLNRLLSLGLDQSWRKAQIRALQPFIAYPVGSRPQVLDLATGTADVALSIARAYPTVQVTGVDPSANMIEVGRQKIQSSQQQSRVSLQIGDGQDLPFDDNQFDAVCISFGIRNIPDRPKALREMARVTKPGGGLLILELSEPRTGWIAPFARLYVHHVVPLLGALLSGQWEYRYLQKSIAAFPPADEFSELMRHTGCDNVIAHRMSFGVAHLYAGTVKA